MNKFLKAIKDLLALSGICLIIGYSFALGVLYAIKLHGGIQVKTEMHTYNNCEIKK